MQIHATNIHGLGASQVVISFLNACSKKGYIESSKIFLPSIGFLSNYVPETGYIVRYKRRLPNGISRVFECLFSRLFFSDEDTIVLGDIPLRGLYGQIVLVHQANLVYPRYNKFSSRAISFRLSRFLFSLNHRYASKIIVQSGSMAKELIESYPSIKDKVVICCLPVPDWFLQDSLNRNIRKRKKKFSFFYPSAFYPHKMHIFLNSFYNYLIKNRIRFENVEILVTLSDKDFEPFSKIDFLRNVGNLSSTEMILYYNKVDALLFLSSLESYGLPLIEAMSSNLPILTVDLPYSRWICEEHAYYFKPYEDESFFNALSKLRFDLNSGIHPDYSRPLTKIPKHWDSVLCEFF